MCGTASNVASAQDIFILEGMAHSPTKPLVIDRPPYRAPLFLIFLASNVAVTLGILRTALETIQEELSTKVSSVTGQALRDQAPIQELMASSRSTLRAVRAGIYELTDEVGELITTGNEIPNQLKAGVYTFTFYAFDTVRETISRLYACGTRAAFLQGHPVERALRNLHAIAFGSEAGRVLLGAEPTLPAF